MQASAPRWGGRGPGALRRPDGVVVLRRHPSEAERGRRHVEAACAGRPEDLVLTATLLASELITNALRHGSGCITLLVTNGRDHVRVDVTDESLSQPTPRSAEVDDENGRGLLIVDSLAHEWGIEPLPRGGGKTVWFTLRV